MNSSNDYPGTLVVIEGVNGSGKTTTINELKNRLTSSNIPASYYKFPDRIGREGDKIDQYLKGTLTIDSTYDILDMFSKNRDAVRLDMINDLRSGKVVICDRYVFSAIAYQIPSHVTDPKKIKRYCNIIGYFDKSMPVPDLIYLIDGDHLHKRTGIVKERFHSMGKAAQRKKEMLHAVIKNFTNRFLMLKNWNGKLDEVVTSIYSDIIYRQRFA